MGTFYYELTYPEAVLSICHNLGKWKGKKKKKTQRKEKKTTATIHEQLIKLIYILAVYILQLSEKLNGIILFLASSHTISLFHFETKVLHTTLRY